MSNDKYVPLGWTETEYSTAGEYNPHGLNNDKPDHLQKARAVRSNPEGELDFGEAYIYDFRLANNEVVHGD